VHPILMWCPPNNFSQTDDASEHHSGLRGSASHHPSRLRLGLHYLRRFLSNPRPEGLAELAAAKSAARARV
jgi:hypothetical protein